MSYYLPFFLDLTLPLRYMFSSQLKNMFLLFPSKYAPGPRLDCYHCKSSVSREEHGVSSGIGRKLTLYGAIRKIKKVIPSEFFPQEIKNSQISNYRPEEMLVFHDTRREEGIYPGSYGTLIRVIHGA